MQYLRHVYVKASNIYPGPPCAIHYIKHTGIKIKLVVDSLGLVYIRHIPSMFSRTIKTSHQFAHQAILLLEAMIRVLIAQVSFAYSWHGASLASP